MIAEKKEQSAPSDQFLLSPVDYMIQFEKENHAGLESQHAPLSGQTTSELATPSPIQLASKKSTFEQLSASNPITHTTNQSSGLPIDIAVTAIAIGICCYSFARKVMFRKPKTMIDMGHESPKTELKLKA